MDEIKIGYNANENNSNNFVLGVKTLAKNTILIGNNLTTNKEYHLLVNQNGVKIDKIMTPEERKLLYDLFVALGLIQKSK